MSYTGLVAEADHPQAGGKQLLDNVVLFDVESSAAKMGHGLGLHQRHPVFFFLEGSLAGFPHALRDHIHRRFQVEVLPLPRVWRAVAHLGQARRMSMEFVCIGTLGTQVPAGDWRLRIAFNRDQLPVLVIDQLAAPHAAVRAYGTRYLSAVGFRPTFPRAIGHGFRPSTVSPGTDLLKNRPIPE